MNLLPELNTMVTIAQATDGCVGARLTGAGFGGCTVNLVENKKVEDFVQALGKGYETETGLRAGIYITSASRGAELMR
jgi:galactokinase